MTINDQYLTKQNEDETLNTDIDTYMDTLMIEFEGYISSEINREPSKKTPS